MELSEFRSANVHLVTGETIVSSLNLSKSPDEKDVSDTETIVLSNKRMMYFSGGLNQKQLSIIPVDEITSVEINIEERSKHAYLWAALAFAVSVSLILIIDPFFIRLVSSLIVGLMGLYLIVDHVMTTTLYRIQFKSNSAEISCMIKPEHVEERAYTFIGDFFELKNNLQDTSDVSIEIEAPEGEGEAEPDAARQAFIKRIADEEDERDYDDVGDEDEDDDRDIIS